MAETRAVLFDLDGTLVGFDDAVYNRAMAAVCRNIGQHYGLDAAHLQQAHREKSIARWRDAEARVFQTATGDVSGNSIMLEIWRDALDAAGCNDAAAAQLGHDAYWADRNGIFYLYEETLEVIQQIHGRLPMAIITNGPADSQLDKLEVLGIDGYFGVIIASGGAGIGKPDPEIFHLALNGLRVEPADAWHVGDNLRADIGGATGAGVRAAWINRTGYVLNGDDPKPDAEIKDLREIIPLLGI